MKNGLEAALEGVDRRSDATHAELDRVLARLDEVIDLGAVPIEELSVEDTSAVLRVETVRAAARRRVRDE